MVFLSGARGEQTREGRLELAAPPAIGRDARYAGSEILRVPRIAHENDSKRGGRLLEGFEKRAVRAIEMRVVEEQNRRVGAAGGLRRAHDLGFGGLDATISTDGSIPWGACRCMTKRASSCTTSSMVMRSASEEKRGKTVTTEPLRARRNSAESG